MCNTDLKGNYYKTLLQNVTEIHPEIITLMKLFAKKQ